MLSQGWFARDHCDWCDLAVAGMRQEGRGIDDIWLERTNACCLRTQASVWAAIPFMIVFAPATALFGAREPLAKRNYAPRIASQLAPFAPSPPFQPR